MDFKKKWKKWFPKNKPTKEEVEKRKRNWQNTMIIRKY